MKLHIRIEERKNPCFSMPDSILFCRLETTQEEAARIKKYGLLAEELAPVRDARGNDTTLYLSSILNAEFECRFNRADQALAAQSDITTACKRIKGAVENLPDDHTGSTTINL